MPKRDRKGSEDDLFDHLAEIDALCGAQDVTAVLAELLDVYSLKSIAYFGVGLSDRPNDAPYLAVTYSLDWIERYRSERFVDIDPIIQVGMRRMLPMDWATFDRSDPNVRRLFGEAGEFGLGRQGISLPVHGRHGDRALLSLTSEASDREWRGLRRAYMRDFQLLALHLHQAVLRLEGRTMTVPALSPRERECLLWIAEGKTYWECGMILGLSEHTVRCYLESARHKLGAANNSHAVNKAAKARLLSDLP